MAETLADVTGVILAGGLGTRLRSRIADRPKVLAPVHGRPYLAYLLDQLAGAGLRNVVLLTGYLAEQIRSEFGDSYAHLRLAYSVEPSPLGTAGALRQALPHLLTPTVLLLNGDSYCAASLFDFREFHNRQGADFSLVLTPVEDCSRYGKVCLGPDDRVLRFEEKSQGAGAGWVNAGIYLLSRSLIEEIPTGDSVSLERDMFPTWAADKRCFGFPCHAQFLDIGTPESYARAEAFFSPTASNCPP
ncbi:MAG TPA: nucleotidyltransferase family protein [Gemmataceae bacterium]|nr:nucleotidyltransferase family protein [Gemmataceae bacterium]